MTKADANRVGLAFIEEAVYGAGGGSNTLQDLRITSESFGQDNDTAISQELRSDRQVADLIRTNKLTSGGFNGELSYGTYDEFFRSLMATDSWVAETADVGASDSIELVIAAAGDTITASSGTPFTAAVGEWIKLGGATAAANNSVFKVTAASSSVLTVEPTNVLVDETITADGAGANGTVTVASEAVNSTNSPESFYFERVYGDLSNEFAAFYGEGVAGHTLTVEPGAIVTLAFEFLGKSETSVTATEGDGSNTAATTTTVMNAIDNVEFIMEGSEAYACTAYNHAITPNLRARQVIGTLGAESLGHGTIGVTGGHTAFYEDKTIMDKHLDMTASNIAVVFKDDAGNYLIFDYPRVKYSNGRRVGGGINQDVLAEMEWTAIRESTEDVTVRIAKIDA